MWKAIEKNDAALASYPDILPNKLYRYRSISENILERLIEFEILDEGIYLAGIKDLNDPNEGRFLVHFSGGFQKIVSYWENALRSFSPKLPSKKIKKLAIERATALIANNGRAPREVIEYTRYVISHVFRIACFTTNPVNYSMWANYAKYYENSKYPVDHGGICIEYNCNENWRAANIHPVLYSDHIPVVNPVSTDGRDFVKTLYTKSTEWRTEEEWRIFTCIDCMPPFPPNLTENSKFKFEGSVSSIIFGLKTPDHIVTEVTNRIKQAGKNITFQRVAHDPTTFERGLIRID